MNNNIMQALPNEILAQKKKEAVKIAFSGLVSDVNNLDHNIHSIYAVHIIDKAGNTVRVLQGQDIDYHVNKYLASK